MSIRSVQRTLGVLSHDPKARWDETLLHMRSEGASEGKIVAGTTRLTVVASRSTERAGNRGGMLPWGGPIAEELAAPYTDPFASIGSRGPGI